VVELPQDIELAVSYAESVARRVYDRETPVRLGFIRDFDGGGHAPPIARLLRGGRGGAVRLKLYLAFLWFAAAPPHDVTYPARAWAGLLGLDDPEGNGARRIIDAITWLGAEDFVDVQRRPGQPSEVRLLSDLGDGERYDPPHETLKILDELQISGQTRYPHQYVRLPTTFWTNAWAAVLSGPAVAMLLILLTQLSDKPAATTELWFSPKDAKSRFGLADDTRSKGLRELESLGLVESIRRPIGRDVFDFRRLRNVYVLQPQRFEVRADVASAQAAQLKRMLDQLS
jgi:hypothetical protein